MNRKSVDPYATSATSSSTESDVMSLSNSSLSVDADVLVDPKLNYFVQMGIDHSQANLAAFGKYLLDSTVHLICDKRSRNESADGKDGGDFVCADNATWLQEAYEVMIEDVDYNFNLDNCGSSNTAAGAVLFHLLIPDHEFVPPKPIPPIGNSWVITLITAELMVAFSVGATCICLSLGLVRKENAAAYNNTAQLRDEMDFNNNASSNGSYYSAVSSSFDLDHENQPQDPLLSSGPRGGTEGNGPTSR